MLNLKNLKYIFLCLLIVSGLYFAILLVNSFNNKPDIKDIGVIKFDNIISNQSLTSSQGNRAPAPRLGQRSTSSPRKSRPFKREVSNDEVTQEVAH